MIRPMKMLLILMHLLFCIIGFSQSDQTIFDIARNGNLDLAKKMHLENPDVFNSINPDGYSPLTLACYRGNLELAKFMINNNTNLNVGSKMGTPLMAAVVKGHLEIIKMLLDHKADINLPDSNGTTCLMYATLFKNKEMVALLLQNKADKDRKDNNGKTAFEYAITNGDDLIINLLK